LPQESLPPGVPTDLQSVVKKGSTSLFCGFAIRLYNNPKMKKGKENET